MGIFSRYLLGELLKMIFPIWFGLGFLMFVLEWLARVFKVVAPVSTVLIMYAYKIPSHLQLVFPLSVLISSMIVLGALNRNREAVAAQSLGLSVKAILIPCIMAASVVGAVNYWVMDHLAPWGMRKYYELEDEYVYRVPSRFLLVRQDKIWYRNRDVLYNVGHFSPTENELYDVSIFSFDSNFHISQTIYAAKAEWTGDGWKLSNGVSSITDKELSTPLSESFEFRTTHLIEDPKALKRVDFNPDTMSQAELFKSIRRHRALGINTARWEVLFHSRLSFFMIAFVFLILSVPLTLRFSRSDAGVGRDATFVSGVCLLYWLLFNFSVNLGNTGKFPPILAAWGPSVLFMIGGIFYLNTLNLKSLSR
jgi:lipopolysaccharide export system permease protein